MGKRDDKRSESLVGRRLDVGDLVGYQPGAVTSIEKWLDPSKRGDR